MMLLELSFGKLVVTGVVMSCDIGAYWVCFCGVADWRLLHWTRSMREWWFCATGSKLLIAADCFPQ
jgi:hypothetical protein